MLHKVLLPVASAGMMLFAVFHVVKAQQVPPTLPPPGENARTPYGRTVAGAGIVESKTENIAIGPHLPGVVTRVDVKVGDEVKAGRVLFRLDDRQLRAELRVREANLAAAEAQLAKLVAMPRPEEVPPSEAKVREAEANLADAVDALTRSKRLWDTRAIGEEEVVKRRNGEMAARQQLARAQADLALLKAGAWDADKAVARVSVEQARAMIDQTKTELDRLEVKASVDGTVLQVTVRPGEFVGASPNQTLVLLGDIAQLHVRADIDANDIPRLKLGVPATCRLRGDPKVGYPLRFVRVEPFVVPKRSLTGDSTERVDTRVLQIIYAFTGPTKNVFVGQQVDVYLAME